MERNAKPGDGVETALRHLGVAIGVSIMMAVAVGFLSIAMTVAKVAWVLSDKMLIGLGL